LTPETETNDEPKAYTRFGQDSMKALDRELDDLLEVHSDSQKIQPGQPSGPPVLKARPPYPVRAQAQGPDLEKHIPAAPAAGTGDRPFPPNQAPESGSGSDLGLGLDDEPVRPVWPDSGPQTPQTNPIFNAAAQPESQAQIPAQIPDSLFAQTQPEPQEPDFNNPLTAVPGPESVRKDPKRPKTGPLNRKFFLIAAIIIAFLVIGLFFLSIWQKPVSQVALQSTDPTGGPNESAGLATQTPPAAAAPLGNADANNSAKLNFVQDQEIHHYRVNKNAGRILIITGRIANGDSRRHSFIRLKGSLKDSRGEVVAERQVFAGNYLTEDELTTLPMPEILARLSIKGGQDNSNVNVPPQKEVPFMLVFDRLPEDLAAYILEPVSSSPSDPGPAPG
jgi:hypothetical protein